MRLVELALALGAIGMSAGLDLPGSEWRVSYLSEATIPADTRIVVNFGDDGEISGFGGRNRFFGGYTISGNTIKIGPIASTRKGCPGLIELETGFFAMLEQATTFEISDAKLVLFDSSGTELAELKLKE